MALVFTVTPGKVFQNAEKVTNAKLNQLGRPTIGVSGVLGPADMALGDYSGELAAGPYFYGLDTGVANAAAVALAPAPAAYVDGMLVAFKVLAGNSGPCTLNVNGLGAAQVYKWGSTPLDAGDWQPAQIVACRYRLDANIIPAGAVYSAGAPPFGSLYTLAVTPGRTYTWTKGANDVSCQVDGSTTLLVTGAFVATGATVTLYGAASVAITATLVPSSNVWQMLSMLGQGPQRYFPMVGATPYLRGIGGLTPHPNAGDQAKYLRADGTWQDLAGQIAGSLASANQEIWKSFNLV